MPLPSDALEASYRICRQISRRAGSTLCAGFLLLPKQKRRAMEALYAFMRYTDDLADGVPLLGCCRTRSLQGDSRLPAAAKPMRRGSALRRSAACKTA